MVDKKAKAGVVPVLSDVRGAVASSSSLITAGSQVSGNPLASLIDLAEDVGRLLARREIAERTGRRGYSLPALLVGAAILTLAWILVGRLLGVIYARIG